MPWYSPWVMWETGRLDVLSMLQRNWCWKERSKEKSMLQRRSGVRESPTKYWQYSPWKFQDVKWVCWNPCNSDPMCIHIYIIIHLYEYIFQKAVFTVSLLVPLTKWLVATMRRPTTVMEIIVPSTAKMRMYPTFAQALCLEAIRVLRKFTHQLYGCTSEFMPLFPYQSPARCLIPKNVWCIFLHSYPTSLHTMQADLFIPCPPKSNGITNTKFTDHKVILVGFAILIPPQGLWVVDFLLLFWSYHDWLDVGTTSN